MKNLFQIGIWTIIASLLLNALETAYFGFNMHPICKQEEQWDVACILLFNLGLCLAALGLLNKNK
tara:strand:+ start:1320 stop:1514 length:195 start_codon:yes stop_codon:yes gene_type:complete